MTIRASERAASERFYRTVLGALGIEPDHADAERVRWDDFLLAGAEAGHPPTRHLHLAFVAPSRERVDGFWRAGTEAGYEDDGKPGKRPLYRPEYYGAFLRDPDGNSVEAVHHADVRRGGHIDHLWIGVSDLAAAIAFFEAIAPHAGLHSGRRWEAGRQFRGAWATLSLVADGRPPTEQLQIAFPAPDRRGVEDFHRAATGAGHRDNRPPRERRCAPGCYAARVIGPDGANVESVFRGGNGPLPDAGKLQR